jgi:DNA primase large subunit
MLLPIQLFINHFFATQTQFIDITTKMDEVESEIRMDLNETDHQSNSESSHDNNKVDYGELSKKLHLCNSDLVELEKRRDFERRLGRFLMAEL